MNRIAALVANHPLATRLTILCCGLLVALGALWIGREQRELERLSLLQTETNRRGIELMSQTLNGNLMGALGLLGTLDPQIKQEARGSGGQSDPQITSRLATLGSNYGAEGGFVVAGNGIIGSAWDEKNKSSTGFNVAFRPYFQTALRGQENVYAAVSQVRGERMLYFSAPIYADQTRQAAPVGAVVARSNLGRIDALLNESADITLLLSPQGVVFASNHKDWIGLLAGEATPDRIRAIREVKQFGDLFASNDPKPLPISVDTGRHKLDQQRYAITRAAVPWNDPLGDWQLILMEDLGRSVPWLDLLPGSVALALLCSLLLHMGGKILRGQHTQQQAARQLQAYADEQTASSAQKTRLAQAGIRLQHACDHPQLAAAFLDEAHHLVGSLQGVVYQANSTQATLNCMGSYGCVGTPAATIPFGHGLLGQCALEAQGRTLDVTDEHAWTIRSGLGGYAPAAIRLQPIVAHGQVLGVLELALLKPLSTQQQEALDALTQLLAVNLDIQQRNAAIQTMLSARTESEQQVSNQLIFQQALIDTIPYPVFYKGPDARFLGFNRAYETTFGVQRGDLIGKCVLELDYLPEADRLAYQAEDEATIANGTQIRREMKIPFADGALHDTLYFVSGFRLQDGTPGGLVGTFIDLGLLHQEPAQ